MFRRSILGLAAISFIVLLVASLAGCGGGGGGGGVSSGGGVSPVGNTMMGGASQGTPLSLASASATVSTFAGTGAYGSTDGAATAAEFNGLSGMTTDGTNLYVVDDCGSTNGTSDIRKIVIATGMVSTLAGSASFGSADGTGTAATFGCPSGITTDGNALYVVDTENSKIRKIAPSSGSLSAMTSANAVVTTLAGSPTNALGSADGTGTAATFDWPSGITTDGTSLYVVDTKNNKIRKITPSSGILSAMTSANAVVTTLAGSPTNTSGAADGVGTAATFSTPYGITSDGTSLYVADTHNNKIRKIVIATGAVSSLTGTSNVSGALGAADGAGTAATFSLPYDITSDGTHLYVVDSYNQKIRMISPSSGTLGAMTNATAVVSSVTGTANTSMGTGAANGAAATAKFYYPWGITTDGSSLYVADTYNYEIRKIH